jgi:hypothetical protein
LAWRCDFYFHVPCSMECVTGRGDAVMPLVIMHASSIRPRIRDSYLERGDR